MIVCFVFLYSKTMHFASKFYFFTLKRCLPPQLYQLETLENLDLPFCKKRNRDSWLGCTHTLNSKVSVVGKTECEIFHA